MPNNSHETSWDLTNFNKLSTLEVERVVSRNLSGGSVGRKLIDGVASEKSPREAKLEAPCSSHHLIRRPHR
jgi:hypothetical protein